MIVQVVAAGERPNRCRSWLLAGSAKETWPRVVQAKTRTGERQAELRHRIKKDTIGKHRRSRQWRACTNPISARYPTDWRQF